MELLPADEKEVAVRAITQTAAPPSRLIEWTRHIEELHKGRYVAAIGRFSDPPRIQDLDALSIDDEDLTDLRRCRPGKCGVKLGDAEIAHVATRSPRRASMEDRGPADIPDHRAG